MSKQRLTAYAMLIATSVIWGFASPVIKFTLTDFPPLVFLTYRFLLTSLVMLPLFVLLDDKMPKVKPRNWLMIITAGLLGSSVNLGLLFWGIDNTTAISASVIAATSPIFVVLAGAFFLREKVKPVEAAGLVIAFIGSLVITISPSITKGGETVFGNLLIILGNVSWVGYVIITKKILQNNISPLFLATSSFLLGFLSLLPFSIVEHGSLAGLTSFIADQPLSAHLGVIYMALFSGALAYWLYQEGQKRIEASEATIFSFLHPIFAIPLALLWLGEKIKIPFVVGAAIIVFGVAIAEWKKKRYN